MVTKEDVVNRDKTHLLDGYAAPEVSDDAYGYEAALTAAGVTVRAFRQFGTYQGEWWAEIEFPNAEVYYVNGAFGSCTYCDAFESEFGRREDEQADYAQQLRDFGRKYVTCCYTMYEAVTLLSRDGEWDIETHVVLAWFEERRAAHQAEAKADVERVLVAMRDTVRLATSRMSSVASDDSKLSLSHCSDMLQRAQAGNFDVGKLNRWLGWMQCVVVTRGAATFDEVRQINRSALLTGSDPEEER